MEDDTDISDDPVNTGHVLCFATMGAGSNDESRIAQLLAGLEPELWPFDPSRKLRSFRRLLVYLARRRPTLVVMEGTGIAGGMALLISRIFMGVRFVVSSGDAVAPFIAGRARALWLPALFYEWLLYRCSSGFIGWTPYLVGRALTFGCRRAVTAPGYGSFDDTQADRARIRDLLGIPENAIVFGLVGALNWTARYRYCYGLELVRSVSNVTRDDLWVLIVGDGNGRSRLSEIVSVEGLSRVLIVGSVPREKVPAYLAAMDVASLPQSVNGVGNFRYTTKLSEYLNAGLPVVTGQIPAAYDLDRGWLWRLPGNSPWSDRYTSALSCLMEAVETSEIKLRGECTVASKNVFDLPQQQRRVEAFVNELLASVQSE